MESSYSPSHIYREDRHSVFFIETESAASLYREERHSLRCAEKEFASSIKEEDGALSSLHPKGVYPISIQKRHTLPLSSRMSLPPLYIEERHSLLFIKKASASSL
jgi:hypothetical protein